MAQVAVLRGLLSDPQPVLDQLRDRYGPDCGLGFGPLRMAIVGDPASLRELFAMPTDSFRWGHKFNILGFVVGDESLIVSDGDDHKRRRSSVQTAFSRRRLNGWIPTIIEQADAAVARMAITERTMIDLYPVARRLVLEITVRAFFGERFAGRAMEIGELFQRPQDYLESPAIKQFPHPIPGTRRSRVRADRRALDAMIDDAVAEIRRAPSGDPLDVLEALTIEGVLSDSEIRDQVITLIGAGYDTTSASLSWMLWRCGADPQIWSRLRAEADEVFGPLSGTTDTSPGAVTGARHDTLLARLEFANRVMRETLRLHPAGVISPREAAIDVTVGGHEIRKGTLILWSAYLAGRDPHFWPNPLTFDPDRFASPTSEQSEVGDAAWVPFGRGARNCIGFALAQMELTLLISRLAQRLDVTPTSSVLPRPVGMVVNRPAGGVPMMTSERTPEGD